MECKVGWLPRPERILIMALGCLIATWWSPALIVMLWLLAVGTNLTALQRITHIWLKSKDTVLEQPVFADNKPFAVANSNGVAAKDKEAEEVLRKRWSFRRVHTR
jgi:hypothetical protein